MKCLELMGALLFRALAVSVAGQMAIAEESYSARRVAPGIPAYSSGLQEGAPVTVNPATEELPFGACDKGLSARDRTFCLRRTSELMDELTYATLKDMMRSLGERPRTNQGQRAYLERTLSQAQEFWLKGRELECGPLARFETALAGDMYEQRLRCLIRADRERISYLKRRYQM